MKTSILHRNLKPCCNQCSNQISWWFSD